MRQRQPRRESSAHLARIRKLPCCVCGSRQRIEAAHIRYGDPAFDKPITGKAEKPDDRWAVPLCAEHHREGPDAQHGEGERGWWERMTINPLELARSLSSTQDLQEMEAAILALHSPMRNGSNR